MRLKSRNKRRKKNKNEMMKKPLKIKRHNFMSLNNGFV